jgi:hypothetical protein
MALGRTYRGKDPFNRAELVMHRTYIALTNALKQDLDLPGNVDIVLPSAYFFSKQGIPSLYSQHFYANEWSVPHTEKEKFDAYVINQVQKIKEKNDKNKKLLLAFALFNVVLFLGACGYIFYKKRKVFVL